jgi:hypothetical protein
MADNSAEQQAEILRKFAESYADTQRVLDPIAQGQRETADKAKLRYNELVKDLKILRGSVEDATNAMRNVADGAGKYAASVEKGAGAFSNFTSQFGKIGKTVGYVIEVFGKLAGGALKQNEALNKTYDALASFGDLDNRSFEQLGKNIRNAGFSVDQNADKFAAAIQKVAPELATFGGSVSQGKQKLLDVFKTTLGGTEKQLERFGITSEEAFGRTANFMKQLAISNGVRGKSDAELNAMSVKYMETLVSLTMITGQTRDEEEKKLQEQQNDLRFQMHLNKLESSGREEDIRQAQQLRATMNVLPKDVADGAKSLIVNQGRIVDDMGARTYQLLGNQGLGKIIDAAKSKAEDFPMALVSMMKSQAPLIEGRFKQLGENIKFGNDTMNDFGLNIDTWNFLQKAKNMDEKQMAEYLKKIRTDGANTDKDNNTQRKKSERAVRNAFEELEYNISKIMIPTLNNFADAVTKIGAGFADILYKITFGKVDIRDAFIQFNNLEDVSKELVKRNKEEIKLKKELSNLKFEDREKELNEILKEQNKLYKEGNKNYDSKKFMAAVKEKEALEEKKKELENKLASNKSAQERARSFGGSMVSQQAGSVETMTAGGGATPKSSGETATLQGLTIKKGDVHREGEKLDPRLVAIARKVQSEMPGFNYFSSFNDNFHKDKKSQHNKGLAFDFTLNHWPTPEEGQKIISQLKGFGADHVIDEYNNPSSNATAGHIHAQLKGKNQGFFKGPESGYWLQAHGEEMLLNKKGWADMVTKMQMPGMGNNSTEIVDTIIGVFQDLKDTIEKNQDLQRASNGLLEDILTYTKA